MPKTVQLEFGKETQLQKQLATLREVLSRGGLIAFPTDTFYGLGANPFDADAVRRLFEVKHRPEDKAVLVLIASEEDLGSLVRRVPETGQKLIQSFWPGPLTLLLEALPRVPGILTAQTGKIGVRVPGNETTRRLIAAVGHPLTAPSANLAGGRDPRTAANVAEALGETVDLIVDGGPAPGGKPSTVLDVTVSPPVLVREGPISRQAIESVLRRPCARVSE